MVLWRFDVPGKVDVGAVGQECMDEWGSTLIKAKGRRERGNGMEELWGSNQEGGYHLKCK